MTIGETAPPAAPGAGGCNDCGAISAGDSGIASYAAPSSGVITKFFIQNGPLVASTDTVQLRIFAPKGVNQWLYRAGTAKLPVPNLPGVRVGFDVQIPIFAGDRLGQYVHYSDTTTNFYTAKAEDLFLGYSSPISPGTQFGVVGSPTTGTRLNIAAQLEADADGDGFGDETQDGCPGNPALQTDCIAPVFESFSLSSTRFAVSPKGASLIASKHKKWTGPVGAAISYVLSEDATVNFEFDALKSGKKTSATKCLKSAPKHTTKKVFGCKRVVKVFSTKQVSSAGSTLLALSGRYAIANKVRKLAPGAYKILATATDAAGNISSSQERFFRIAR